MDGQVDEEIPATLFRLFMIMETDGSATLRFIKSIQNFKELEQLRLTLSLGAMEKITQNVQFRYNYALAEY